MAKQKKEAFIKIQYCKGKTNFPALEKYIPIQGRGRLSAVDAEHFAKEHCLSHGLIFINCESLSFVIEEESRHSSLFKSE